MHPAKIRFLFGTRPAGFDIDDPAVRESLLAPEDEDEDDNLRFQGTLRAIIANQIADDNPRQTWATAQRLLSLGMTREQAMNELTMTLGPHMVAVLSKKEPFDTAGYLSDLAKLPLPSPDQIWDTCVRLTRELQPVAALDLEMKVAAEFGRESDDPIMESLIDSIMDELVLGDVLEYLLDDLVIHPVSLLAGVTLTHEIEEEELSPGILKLSADLSAFGCHPDPTLPDGLSIGCDVDQDGLHWHLPDNLSADFRPQQILAVQVAEDGVATLSILDNAPDIDPILLRRIRYHYDRKAAEADLPVPVKDLVYSLCAENRATFNAAQAPMKALCAAAGLELRDAMVAHDEELWENQREFRLAIRAGRTFDHDMELAEAAIEVISLARQTDPAPSELKLALRHLARASIAGFVTKELIGLGHSEAEQFAAALTRAAGKGKSKAVAHWFAALIAEQSGEHLVADAHLKIALGAGVNWEPVLERAAWYAFDRGDAPAASALYRRLRNPDEDDLRLLSRFDSPPRPAVGRNEPCWCGSGRRFKQCHLNKPAGFPLPERVGWLARKSAMYAEHQFGALDQAIALGTLLASDPTDEQDLAEALVDPLTMDLLLTEGGWFEEFLEQRAPLLPEDEVLLARSWTMVARTVYRVEEIRPGQGVTLRDLATGDSLQVRERSFSRQAQDGWMVCARAVPDGESNQFVGGIFIVKPGQEETVLDLCATGDPFDIAAWVGGLYRPPKMTTREGEPIVSCEAVWRVDDPSAARRELDAAYEPQEERWVENHPIAEDELILRATIQLDADLITVNTMSEERMDRVLEVLEFKIGGELISDEREPFIPGTSGPVPSAGLPAEVEMDPVTIKQIQESMETRWMNESVPALAGLTPRQAAADPTRREQLERLLDSFDQMPSPPGAITFRVHRLRQELGLEQGLP